MVADRNDGAWNVVLVEKWQQWVKGGGSDILPSVIPRRSKSKQASSVREKTCWCYNGVSVVTDGHSWNSVVSRPFGGLPWLVPAQLCLPSSSMLQSSVDGTKNTLQCTAWPPIAVVSFPKGFGGYILLPGSCSLSSLKPDRHKAFC